MKFISIRVISSILMLTVAAFTPNLSAESTNQRSVVVQGAGAIGHAPDQGRLRVLFMAKDQQVSSAKKVVDLHTQSFTNFVLSKKIAKPAISNALLRVRAEYPTAEQPKPGFVAEREVSVLITDLALYPELVDYAATLGQVDIQPLELLQSNAEKLYEQALVAAIDDAKSKATLLAKQSGAKLGPVLKITELTAGQPIMHKMAMSAESGVEMGTQMLKAEVSVEYQLVEP